MFMMLFCLVCYVTSVRGYRGVKAKQNVECFKIIESYET